MFCKQCGAEIADQAVICVKCGVPNTPLAETGKSEKSRVGYILVALFLGGLGFHNLYIGRSAVGGLQFLITIGLILLGYPQLAFGVSLWALVEAFTVTKDHTGKTLK